MNTRRSRVDEWTRDAGCRDEPPERFTDPKDADEVRRALETCTHCPVRRQCLTTALGHAPDADVGIWGGTTELTRERIRNGELTIDDVLLRKADVQTRWREDDRGTTSNSAVPRLTAPEITLGRDSNGDYVDATGRVTVFRIQGDPPYMLMIDDRCIARTRTVTEARRLAWTALHHGHARLTPAASTRGRLADLARK